MARRDIARARHSGNFCVNRNLRPLEHVRSGLIWHRCGSSLGRDLGDQRSEVTTEAGWAMSTSNRLPRHATNSAWRLLVTDELVATLDPNPNSAEQTHRELRPNQSQSEEDANDNCSPLCSALDVSEPQDN